MTDDPKVLMSVDALGQWGGRPGVAVLDGSWYLPGAGRDARAEYQAAHIPGARFFDIDAISDMSVPLPHMAPPPDQFTNQMRALGIGDGDQVVVYDGTGLFSAARVWWLFRLMGWDRVAVLDGGLPKWRAEGWPVRGMAEQVAELTHLWVDPQMRWVRNAADVSAALALGSHEVVDARSPARFRGEEPEPRPGVRQGHIPGSKNLHFRTLMNPDATLKSPAALRQLFAAADVDLAKPVITLCGSGVTAAILNLALERIGHKDHALYDGSWAEWGAAGDLPVALG